MVLSHGHADHHTGLEGLFSRIGRAGMPLILHPDAWRGRKITFPTGVEVHMPPPSHQDLDREGWQVIDCCWPCPPGGTPWFCCWPSRSASASHCCGVATEVNKLTTSVRAGTT